MGEGKEVNIVTLLMYCLTLKGTGAKEVGGLLSTHNLQKRRGRPSEQRNLGVRRDFHRAGPAEDGAARVAASRQRHRLLMLSVDPKAT